MCWQTELRKEILKDIGIRADWKDITLTRLGERGRKLVFFWPIMMSLGLGIWCKKMLLVQIRGLVAPASSLKMRGELYHKHLCIQLNLNCFTFTNTCDWNLYALYQSPEMKMNFNLSSDL